MRQIRFTTLAASAACALALTACGTPDPYSTGEAGNTYPPYPVTDGRVTTVYAPAGSTVYAPGQTYVVPGQPYVVQGQPYVVQGQPYAARARRMSSRARPPTPCLASSGAA